MYTEFSVNNGELEITTHLTHYDIEDEMKKYGIEKITGDAVLDVLDAYCMDKDHDSLMGLKPVTSLGEVIKIEADYLNEMYNDE